MHHWLKNQMFLSFQGTKLVDLLRTKTFAFPDRVVVVDTVDVLMSVRCTDMDSLQHIHHWVLGLAHDF